MIFQNNAKKITLRQWRWFKGSLSIYSFDSEPLNSPGFEAHALVTAYHYQALHDLDSLNGGWLIGPPSIIIYLKSYLFICLKDSNILPLANLSNIALGENATENGFCCFRKSTPESPLYLVWIPFMNSPISSQVQFNPNGNIPSMSPLPENNQSSQLPLKYINMTTSYVARWVLSIFNLSCYLPHITVLHHQEPLIKNYFGKQVFS